MQNELKKSHLFDCLTEKQKAKGKRKGVRAAERELRKTKRVANIRRKPCPDCGSSRIYNVHIASRRLPFWWRLECWGCHYCGGTRLSIRRAIKSWNRRATDGE
jgi:hypothetical protein